MDLPPTNKGADLGFCSEGWYAAARAERDMPGLDPLSKRVCKAHPKGSFKAIKHDTFVLTDNS